MIRPAGISDIPEVIRLSETMHQESRYRELPYSGQKFAALLRRLIDSPDGMVAVAEKNGRIVGAIAAVITEHYFADAHISYELGLYVEKAHRGTLAGYRLAKEYIEWAKSKGVDQIDMGITTDIDEERTGKMYERLGLKHVGIVFSGGK
ncbi:GNAT family N-acetyltransferase [Cedecea sp. NFIX57]|uniref:GNAT family N-acetyltransferase n=1 Tax=Cedecea sp. NFIX57 TaxID=1566286 RepID=UPI000A0E2F58|nr:GNAT family N-acetyltransferase [Cedecea sp. NFIX57]SMG60161.1 L-amino acid N-acyltransferase YncA [Cedecea sp. NFIX57]